MIDCSILSEIESELGTLGISIANVLPTESFCSEYARDVRELSTMTNRIEDQFYEVEIKSLT